MVLALVLAASTVGKPAPDFALGEHSRQSLKGKVVVLMFLGTRCPVSNAYSRRLHALWEDYAARGVAFVGVDLAPAPDSEAKKGPGFPVVRDAGGAAEKFRVAKVPEAVVLDAEGVVRYRGRIDNSQDEERASRNDLREALGSIVNGARPQVSETPPMGCALKKAR